MNDIPIFGTPEALPSRTGILWLADVELYEDPRAGVRFQYRYWDKEARQPAGGNSDLLDTISERLTGPKPDFRLVKADAYLYDLGLPTIPADLKSEEMSEIFHHALAEIAAAVKEGQYQQFELMTTGLLKVPPATAEPTWLWAAMRYRQAKGPLAKDDQDRVSHLAVRTDAGHINKVRYTYPSAIPQSLAYADFLLFLFEWRHSIAQVLAGKLAIPPFGAPHDSEWLSAVTDLRTASLSESLCFFDPTQALARQAELLAEHLTAEAGSQESENEEYEIREAILHETAHAVFSILEREMALDAEIGGFGTFVDRRSTLKS